jgi:hypothetical protein
MDALSIIITLVTVVAGILQIILFFKVWGMCNDIKALRKATIKEEGNTIPEEDKADNSLSWLVVIAVVAVIVIVIACLK